MWSTWKVGPSDLREGRFGRGCPEGRGQGRAAWGLGEPSTSREAAATPQWESSLGYLTHTLILVCKSMTV